MRYVVRINNDERLTNDEDDTLESVTQELRELLESGYFELEQVQEVPYR